MQDVDVIVADDQDDDVHEQLVSAVASPPPPLPSDNGTQLIELQLLQPPPQLPQPSTSSASSNGEVAEPADKHEDEICAACNAEDPPRGKNKSARVP